MGKIISMDEYRQRRQERMEAGISAQNANHAGLQKKMLFGVTHIPKVIAPVIAALETFEFSRMGLELSPAELAAVHSQEPHASANFFKVIAAHYQDKGIEVVPIDHPTIREDAGGDAFLTAYYIATGRYTSEQIEGKMRSMRNEALLSYDNLEKAKCMHGAEILRQALEIAKRGKEVIEQMNHIDGIRNMHMLDSIRRSEIPMAVIGDEHARKIIRGLPEHGLISINFEVVR